MLTVVPAALLLVACGAPEAVPVAPAAAVSPATATRTASATPRPAAQPLGVVPVDMGPTPAQEVAARVAAQAGNPPPPRRQAAPKPAPKPAAQPVLAQPAPKPAPKPAPQPAAGTASGCNANYTPCVPNDSDVDCQGGSGNGPSYVRGPVQVTGSDVYGPDADDDGIGCE